MKEKPSCYEAALNYLDRAIHSEREVRNKLYEKQYTSKEIEEAIKKLNYYHFIDDERYCQIFIDSYKRKTGFKKIRFKLITEKGIDEKIVDACIEKSFDEDEEIVKAKTMALKYLKGENLSLDNYQKTCNHLYSKGFEFYIINKTMDILKKESKEEIDETL